MVNSLKRPESRMAFGSNLVKPSELFGSVKRTINRNRQSRCQCKHHQQKLLARQEEQRQQLQQQLRSRGDRRKIDTIHSPSCLDSRNQVENDNPYTSVASVHNAFQTQTQTNATAAGFSTGGVVHQRLQRPKCKSRSKFQRIRN